MSFPPHLLLQKQVFKNKACPSFPKIKVNICSLSFDARRFFFHYGANSFVSSSKLEGGFFRAAACAIPCISRVKHMTRRWGDLCNSVPIHIQDGRRDASWSQKKAQVPAFQHHEMLRALLCCAVRHSSLPGSGRAKRAEEGQESEGQSGGKRRLCAPRSDLAAGLSCSCHTSWPSDFCIPSRAPSQEGGMWRRYERLTDWR